MSLRKRSLTGLGMVLILVIVMIVIVQYWHPTGQDQVSRMSMDIGSRTITVTNYKILNQESMADGMKITADGHVITATPGELTVDGKPQTLDPAQDVDIALGDKGDISVNPVGSPKSQ